jgi:CheY-like chemotaxis protein
MLELMKEHLLDLGVKPILADNAQQGIDAARQRKPDLVLLDVMMPEMTGGEVAAALKRDVGTAGIPIVFLSGVIDSDDCVRSPKGGYQLISKHLSPEGLISKLAECLDMVEC